MGNRNQLGSKYKCDRKGEFLTGWYRMMAETGDQIPEECVPKGICGTAATGWLNGKHPAVEEGIVTREICYLWDGNCCRWKNDIKILNYGGYYVYELPPAPICFARYCGNHKC